MISEPSFQFHPQPTSSRLRVAVVEDDPFLGPFLAKVIQRTPGLTLTRLFSDGALALEHLPEDHPDVVLADLGLPKVRGNRLVRALKKRLPDAQIVVLTGCIEANALLAAMRGGAAGYLLKPSSAAEIVHAIHEAASKRHALNAKAAGLVRHHRLPRSKPRDWSRREMQVLDLVSEGLCNEEIAHRMNLSVETVRSHLKRVYAKLGVSSRAEAAVMHLAETTAA